MCCDGYEEYCAKYWDRNVRQSIVYDTEERSSGKLAFGLRWIVAAKQGRADAPSSL